MNSLSKAVRCANLLAVIWWLPMYLPDSFPNSVRATGSGITYNTGCFTAAFTVALLDISGYTKRLPEGLSLMRMRHMLTIAEAR